MLGHGACRLSVRPLSGSTGLVCVFVQLRAEDPLLESPLSDLAPDALLDLPALPLFAQKLRASAAPVKALLLDQERVRRRRGASCRLTHLGDRLTRQSMSWCSAGGERSGELGG